MSKARSTNGAIENRSPQRNGDSRERFVNSCQPLVKRRLPVSLSRAEQSFSSYAQRQLLRLLNGKEERFRLMRRYYDPDEIGFFLPPRLNKAEIRAGVAEDIVYGVLQFLQPFGMGGPIEQRNRDEKLTETQLFPTRYPHLLVRRQDRYEKRGLRLTDIDWQVVSVRRQKSMLFEGVVDVGKLAIDIAKFLPIL